MTADIIRITDPSAPELAAYAHLNENQLRHYYEPAPGIFIGESPNVILRGLDAGYEPVSFLTEEKYIETEAAPIIERLGGVPVYTAPLSVLSRITGYHLTRGILCAFRRKPLPSVRDVCRGARRIAVLENIENPTNVGAVFRSAAALGVDAVLLTRDCSDPLYRRTLRVSVGTVFQVPWTYFPGAGRKKDLPFCGNSAFRLPRWRCGMTRSALTIRSFTPSKGSRLSLETKGTDLPQRRLRTVITRSGFRWRTAWIP